MHSLPTTRECRQQPARRFVKLTDGVATESLLLAFYVIFLPLAALCAMASMVLKA